MESFLWRVTMESVLWRVSIMGFTFLWRVGVIGLFFGKRAFLCREGVMGVGFGGEWALWDLVFVKICFLESGRYMTWFFV